MSGSLDYSWPGAFVSHGILVLLILLPMNHMPYYSKGVGWGLLIIALGVSSSAAPTPPGKAL